MCIDTVRPATVINTSRNTGTRSIMDQTNYRCLYATAIPTTVLQIDKLLTTYTLFYRVLLCLTSYKHCYRDHCDTRYMTTVIVLYFNML